MGHLRLRILPNTRKWRDIVALIRSGAPVEDVAAATMEAAREAFATGADDEALVHAFWLLTQIPLAARQKDFAAALRDLGLNVSETPGPFEISAAFHDAIQQLDPQRSEVGHLAVVSAVATLLAHSRSSAMSLFDTEPALTRDALARAATSKNFGALAKDFFARFSQSFLNALLSRELSNHVGPDSRFASVREHEEFIGALDLHCRQSAVIVDEFAGGWFSKANFEGGITREKARGLVHVALDKLSRELMRQAV